MATTYIIHISPWHCCFNKKKGGKNTTNQKIKWTKRLREEKTATESVRQGIFTMFCVGLVLFDYIMMMIIGIEYKPVFLFKELAAIELEFNKALSLIIAIISIALVSSQQIVLIINYRYIPYVKWTIRNDIELSDNLTSLKAF